ncbi:polyamine transporter 3 [Pleomassaria siparia CBS 279.74]|uniref:Polyamine transporter 3 n=1 Tax=Pleomassaria siparia CBS 279.74 TaxID=1314801 RepID=A0A6G1K474_9PLEO|nr:polyamine transporter 3 [Pleomassaria siparia CBS 279.74]
MMEQTTEAKLEHDTLSMEPQSLIQDHKHEAQSQDPDRVDWDGLDDAENPQNWKNGAKWFHIAVISAMTFVTPLGSSMFAPGIRNIMREFHETSSTIATFCVSVYVLGFAFGPLLIAPLSEIYGRKYLYVVGNILFTVFCIATALSKDMDMLLAFRFLMGCAGAVPITIGSGTIADMMPVEKRGTAMSAWALGPLLGPCIGPIAGGYLTQAAGWRWVFWVIAIVGGVFIPMSVMFLKETYVPVILEKKTARLRKARDNPRLYSALSITTRKETASQKFKNAIFRPILLLTTVPLVISAALYVAIVYGVLYLLISTFSFVYSEQYGFTEGTVGLTFLPAGIGMMLGICIFGPLGDYMIKQRQAQNLPIVPEIRLNPLVLLPCATLLPAGLFIYGWTAQYGVHYVVPMFGVVIFCIGLMGVMMCIQNYLLDTYPTRAASVTAALTVLRSLAGALLPLGGLEMYNALGLGWGNSLLAFIAVGMIPLPLMFYMFGKRVRGWKSSQFS